jgi:hypothetical protein
MDEALALPPALSYGLLPVASPWLVASSLRFAFPMMPSLTFQVAPVELVQSLKRDNAILFGAERRGDFLPRPALLALLADEFHKRFEAAVEWSSAAGTISFHRLLNVDGF